MAREGSNREATILFVDDETELLSVFRRGVEDTHTVRTASNGEEALETIDRDVDIVFLDREMPDMMGDEVLEELRDRGYDCKVCMLTGVAPEKDITEMEFDDYIEKPVTVDNIHEEIEELLEREEYSEDMQDLFAKASKREALRDEDTELVSTWGSDEIRSMLDERDDTDPLPSAFGDWKSTEMVDRGEKEHQFVEEQVTDSLTPIPIAIQRRAEVHPEAIAMGYKPDAHSRSMYNTLPKADDGNEFATLTYGELEDIVRHLALAFDALGVGENNAVATISAPRIEASIVDLSVLTCGGISVGLDADAAPIDIKNQIEEAGASGVVVDTEERLQNHITAFEDAGVSFVICMDNLGGGYDDIKTVNEIYAQAVKHGDPERFRQLLNGIDADGAAALTKPGDRSEPVVLSHRNIRANADQIAARLAASKRPPLPQPFGARAAGIDEETPAFSPGDSFVSALQFGPIANRILTTYTPPVLGSPVYYTQSANIHDDLKTVEPEVLIAAPKVCEQVYENAYDNVMEDAGFLQERLEGWCSSTGDEYWRSDDPGRGTRIKAWASDALLHKKIREYLGGIQTCVACPGQVSESIAHKLFAAGIAPVGCYAPDSVGCVVGMTAPDDPKFETNGVPLYGQSISTGPTPTDAVEDGGEEIGELLIKGPNISKKVWMAADGGARSYLADDSGRVQTGETVRWDTDDRLRQS